MSTAILLLYSYITLLIARQQCTDARHDIGCHEGRRLACFLYLAPQALSGGYKVHHLDQIQGSYRPAS